MPTDSSYAYVLVVSTGHALRAEGALKRAGIGCRLVPVPRHLSSDCGVCVRVAREDVPAAQAALDAAGAAYEEVRSDQRAGPTGSL